MFVWVLIGGFGVRGLWVLLFRFWMDDLVVWCCELCGLIMIMWFVGFVMFACWVSWVWGYCLAYELRLVRLCFVWVCAFCWAVWLFGYI